MNRFVFRWNAFFACFATFLALSACGGGGEADQNANGALEKPAPLVMAPAPTFEGDTALAFAQAQVDFGPRVPNTIAHQLCGDYLIERLEAFGCEVTVQEFEATAYDQTKLRARNIVGSINPQAKKRIMLAAHWDTRPYADAESDSATMRQPIEGANDGASGVAVLLEIARTIHAAEGKPSVGVDLVLFDVEDYGAPKFYTQAVQSQSYCLGSQYWKDNKHAPGYHAYFGVLLDMVGAEGAYFPQEGYSRERAPKVVDLVWRTASQLGYGDYFVEAEGPFITDDHFYVNEAGVPMIDVIHLSRGDSETFFPHWHTTEDTMNKLSPATLKAVGQTVLQVVYNQK